MFVVGVVVGVVGVLLRYLVAVVVVFDVAFWC